MKFTTGSAVIIGDYRYELRRIWNKYLPLLVVCMLNPSTADAEVNDPTIKFLMAWADLQGYGGLLVVNENAFRSPSPQAMRLEDDPRGPYNTRYLDAAIRYAKETTGKALAAWGNGCDGRRFTTLAEAHGVDLICLGMTNDGSPKHPMARGKHKIPTNQPPILWRQYHG